MEVSGQLHASTAVLLGKQSLVRILRDTGLDAMRVNNLLPIKP
jgi:hypothetical protein